MTKEEFKHSVKLQDHESLGLAVFNCGFQRCAPEHTWGPAVRDHYLIHYITSGHGIFDNGHEVFHLSSGDGFLAVPSKIVSYTADASDPWEYYWVGFNGTDAGPLVSQAGLSEYQPIFHYGKDSLYREKLLNIYRLTGSRPSDQARMKAALLLFLAAMMDNCPLQEDSGQNGYEYVKKSLRFIDFNYSRPINVDDIASNAGISRSHLYRLFMQYVSIPPNEYLTRYRIQKACILLKNHHLSIGEAAYSTGFSDQLYFSRVFKKYKGVPPSQYADSHRERKERRSL